MFASSLEQEFDPYAILGVIEGICPKSPELKSAWRLAVRKWHPDRHGGTKEGMQNAMLAYEILTDPKKKKIFDQFGLKAVQELKSLKSQQREPNPFIAQESPKEEKTELHTILKVQLSDFYCGITRTVRVKYRAKCDVCFAGKSRMCPFCQGKGEDIHVLQNPTSVFQKRKACAHCNGDGVSKSPCFLCKGAKTIKIKTKLTVDVEPGMRDGQTILVETPSLRAAVTLKLRKHKVFRVSGNDLCFSKKITLKDCIQGSTFTVHTLDGRNLHINTPPNMVLNSGRPFKIPDEGLPIYKQHGRRGALYIRFAVELPQELGPADAKFFEHLTSSKSPTAEREPEDEQKEEFSTLLHLKRGGDSLPHPVKRHLISVSKVAPIPSEDSIASRGTGFSMQGEGKNDPNRVFWGGTAL